MFHCGTMSLLEGSHSVKCVTNMAVALEKDIQTALSGVEIPYLDQNILEAGLPVEVERSETSLSLRLRVGFPLGARGTELAAQIEGALREETGLQDVKVDVETHIVSHAVQGTLAPLPGVKNIIAVASGKGGVGKSSVAVNLALALARDGAQVGILDADIYGPSQPRMLGMAGKNPETLDGKTFEPLEAHGIQFISVGCLVDEKEPTIWRGPMATQALTQLLMQTNWRDLDYLIVDMPPGTGDIQLTLSQKVPVSGAIIVTTPQDIAMIDAYKGLQMFRKVKVTVLGVIENMSVFVCPECGAETNMFGEGGGDEIAQKSDLPVLGRLPLDIRIRQETDAGKPTVVAAPDSDISAAFHEIARASAARLSQQKREYKGAFPEVVVERQ
jgi:ATP-binding protein involved in chromosome partitioning